ncbi:hypothetical protein AB0G79_27220 [Streptomyces sp. NPDC020807]|uniref:hypothetical protein n=1 Tax=Streptomyces sp. NPDC020807 TaxID=3155119 RepID=UPI0033C0BBE5
MASDRAPRLRRLARTLTERFGLAPDGRGTGGIEAEWSASARTWTFVWTDGPAVAQVRDACREADPGTAGEGVRYVRAFSEDAVALGAVRLAVRPGAGAGRRPLVRPDDVELLWREESFPQPCTDRERALVYALVYEVHDAHRINRAGAEEICGFVNRYGLAVLLRRSGAELSPLDVLTAHYAASHAHPAWRYRLTPMDAEVLFRAVREDPRAPVELITAALALLPGLPAGYDEGGDELRARLAASSPP